MGNLKNKTVDIKTNAPLTSVNALQAAISALQGKTVTIKVNVVETQGGSTGTGKLNKAQVNDVTQQVQASLLQQARRNPQTGLKLLGKAT